MEPAALLARIDAIAARMADRLHARPRPLPALLDASGTRLPRAARTRARELVEAQARLSHPATATRTDLGRVADLCTALERDLDAIPEGRFLRHDWRAAFVTAGWRVAVVAVLALVVVWLGGLA
ncbi:hypothetical protein JQC91_00380 [Jannaschia sp. Os4]|uniref:hypothetical protein n=1 Tax=Jannaschia sp. Os4 TaxID=2807617 RepID=UPI00193A67E8|nr:hypothetical protein [Jannaschia sp. Os4]MBM2574746.1 hypothetical protein [Jannaschia sp. Os4]